MDIGLLVQGEKAYGAFILTASHNAGGPHEVNTLYTKWKWLTKHFSLWSVSLGIPCAMLNVLTWNIRITCLGINDFLLAFHFVVVSTQT